MKLLIKILVAIFLFAIIWNYIKRPDQQKALLSFSSESGHFSINVREPEKSELKDVVKKVSNIIYREATIHNPPGDVLPDQIDDKVKEEIKAKIN